MGTVIKMRRKMLKYGVKRADRMKKTNEGSEKGSTRRRKRRQGF